MQLAGNKPKTRQSVETPLLNQARSLAEGIAKASSSYQFWIALTKNFLPLFLWPNTMVRNSKTSRLYEPEPKKYGSSFNHLCNELQELLAKSPLKCLGMPWKTKPWTTQKEEPPTSPRCFSKWRCHDYIIISSLLKLSLCTLGPCPASSSKVAHTWQPAKDKNSLSLLLVLRLTQWTLASLDFVHRNQKKKIATCAGRALDKRASGRWSFFHEGMPRGGCIIFGLISVGSGTNHHAILSLT